ncbi:hypothetical protein MKC73_02010 [[Clostridium] innocuum]|nr:hypothetical protein [[Clostridium] innocuum]
MHKVKGQKVMGGLTLCMLGLLTIANIITRDANLVLDRRFHERVKAESDAGSVTPFEWQPGAKVFMTPDLELLTLVEQGSMITNKVKGSGQVTHAEAKATASAITNNIGVKTATSSLMSTSTAQQNTATLSRLSDVDLLWWTDSVSDNKAGIIGGTDVFGYQRTYQLSNATQTGCESRSVTESWNNITINPITEQSIHYYDPPRYSYSYINTITEPGQPFNQCIPLSQLPSVSVQWFQRCTFGYTTNDGGYACNLRPATQRQHIGDILYVWYENNIDRPDSCDPTSHVYIRNVYNDRVIALGTEINEPERICETNIAAPTAYVRPQITLNPDAIVFASTPDAERRKAGKELSSFTGANTRSLSAAETAGYKLTLLDNAMSLSDVKVQKDDSSVLQNGNKIHIKKGTSTLTLDASTVGDGESTPNGIAALSYDSAGNEVIGTLASITGAGTNEITIDLSNLMDVNTLGSSKKISLFAEQQNGAKTTDYMSAPYDIEVVVSEEQKLSLDAESQAKNSVMYGETLELTALVNDGNTTIGWAEDTPLTASILEADKSKVEIKSQKWDEKTGQLLIQLNPLTGGDATFQLELNKEASVLDKSYRKADSVKSQQITLRSRPITVTPKGNLLYDGNPFSDFPWDFETKLSDESISGDALVNGDTLPYAVETTPLTVDTPASPQVNKDGLLTVENGGKEWALSVKGKDASETEIFERKYTVTKNNYDPTANKDSKLRVDAFKEIEIIKNPDDAMAKKDDTYRFIVQAKYDVGIPNHEGTTDLIYQEFSYQWEISTDDGTTWEEAPGNSTALYDNDNGIATLTYTGTNVQTAEEGALFRCRVWNKRNTINNTMPTSDIAKLSVRTDPAVFIEIPKTVEMEKEDSRLITTKDMQKIKLIEFENKVSTNKTSKQTIPEGAFQIKTNPTFQLSLIQEVEDTRKAIYDVTVYKEDNHTPLSEQEELMTLNQKDKKEGGFYIKTLVDNDKPRGTYKGKMVFTITYTPKSVSE